MTIAILNDTDSYLDLVSLNSSSLRSTCKTAPTCGINNTTCVAYSFIAQQCITNPNPALPCARCPNQGQGVCFGSTCVCITDPPPSRVSSPSVSPLYDATPSSCLQLADGLGCIPTASEFTGGSPFCYACLARVCVFTSSCPNLYGPFNAPSRRRNTPSSNAGSSQNFVSISGVLGITLGVFAVIFFAVYTVLRMRLLRASRIAAIVNNGMQANMDAVNARAADKIDPNLLPQPFHLAKVPIAPDIVSSAFAPQCVICYDSCSNSAISPCGHIMCWSCLSQLDSCPMCRCPIVAKILMQPTPIPSANWNPAGLAPKLRKGGMGLCGCCNEHKMLIQTSLPCCHLFCDKQECSANAVCPVCQQKIQSYLPIRWVSAEDSEISRLERSKAGPVVATAVPTPDVGDAGSSSDDKEEEVAPPAEMQEAWDKSEGSIGFDD